MSILIDKIRIFGFRGIQNIEIDLEPTTVLTGMNNAGKTSFLKAVQLALGNKQFVTNEDFYSTEIETGNEIIIDVRIVPINESGEKMAFFSEDWEILFTEKKIKTDRDDKQHVPLRTIVSQDKSTNSFKTKQYILVEWAEFGKEGENPWYKSANGIETSFHFDELPFFYMDAQRDIIDDIKAKSSYLGKMFSNIKYSQEDVKNIEAHIKKLNEDTVNSSEILSTIEKALEGVGSALDNSRNGVEITPFPKKIRDMNKGVSIQYADFSMEYHGMGTRSWSSLLTMHAFVSVLKSNNTSFYPIIAIEEPEAHLHPSAQKKLFGQIAAMPGQKIISTHSAYIAASAELHQIRSFYKDRQGICCGKIEIKDYVEEDIRKIKRQVISSKGELFFSKAIVLFEGETEEQALPIFAEKYFGPHFNDLGIDFVGVGGAGNYLPFIRFAKSLKIPWVILSDGETKTIKEVTNALKAALYLENVDLSKIGNVFVLEDGCKFETYLLKCGYQEEIERALEQLEPGISLRQQIHAKEGKNKAPRKTQEICNECKQYIYKEEKRDYSGDSGYKQALIDLMSDKKTKFGPAIAEAIVKSNKTLPPKIVALFEKIDELIQLKKQNND